MLDSLEFVFNKREKSPLSLPSKIRTLSNSTNSKAFPSILNTAVFEERILFLNLKWAGFRRQTSPFGRSPLIGQLSKVVWWSTNKDGPTYSAIRNCMRLRFWFNFTYLSGLVRQRGIAEKLRRAVKKVYGFDRLNN